MFGYLESISVVVWNKRWQKRRAGVALVEKHQRYVSEVQECTHVNQRSDRGSENNPDTVTRFQLTDDVQCQLDVITIVVDSE